MKIPKLHMESTMGRIRIEQTPAKIDMRQPRADQSIQQPKAEMNMTKTEGKLTIDQTKAWEDRFLMSTIRLNELHAQAGVQALQEGVARRVDQGNQLVKIEQNVNAIAEQARENGGRKISNIGIKYIPEPFSVKINYEPSELNIAIEPRRPIIDVEINKPEINFHRGAVQIDMEQYPKLDIYVVDLYA